MARRPDLHEREDRIFGILGRALEVDARHQPAQQASGEQAEVDVGRLQRVAAAGHAPRADGGEPEAALGVAGAAPEAVERGIERLGLAVFGMGIAAGGVGLPDLDEGIGHRGAVAVEDATGDLDALALRVRFDQRLGARPGEEVEERADGLRGVWPGIAQPRAASRARPRSTMSKR